MFKYTDTLQEVQEFLTVKGMSEDSDLPLLWSSAGNYLQGWINNQYIKLENNTTYFCDILRLLDGTRGNVSVPFSDRPSNTHTITNPTRVMLQDFLREFLIW